MAKQKKTYFFNASADLNSRGKRKNFNTDGQPSQEVMTDLMDSVAMFDEAGSRANLDTGGAEFKDEVGLVGITTDAKAKANTSGIEADRTLVPHAGQLPTVNATDTQDITGTDPFSGVVLDATADGTSTRNNYLIKLSGAFLTWFQALKDKVYGHDASISANTSGVSTNAGNISTNAGLISANTSNIGTNASGVATNAGNIGTNATNIGTNSSNISGNTSNISSNSSTISSNTSSISSNTSNISANTSAISGVQAQVGGVKIIEFALPVWDMDAVPTLLYSHGLGLSASELLTITNLSVWIHPNSPGLVHPLMMVSSAIVLQGGVESISGTQISMYRLTGGVFDSTSFNGTASSRGVCRFSYIPD